MWPFSKVPYHLPKTRGPYITGIMDVMLDYSVNGLFMRMYYPTDEKISIETDYSKWVHTLPDDDYVAGIASVVMIPTFLMNVIWWRSGKIRIPALYGANVKSNGKLKVIIFSHGLGALRSFHSCVCNELASRGFLVCVLEHRDESACHTYYFNSKEEAQRNQKTVISFKTVNFGPGHYEIRSTQVNRRADEFCKALDFLIELNNGEVPYNVMQDIPGQNNFDFKLNDLVGRLDLNDVTAAGHSFGGATALLALSRRSEFSQGVIMDPWMFPIKDDELETKIKQPLLFINTQTFHIKSNVYSMGLFLDSSSTNREMYTILKTTHENQSDSVFLAGYWLNWFMSKLDPKRAVYINNSLIMRFLKNYIGGEDDCKDCLDFLKENHTNFTSGLTKAWA